MTLSEHRCIMWFMASNQKSLLDKQEEKIKEDGKTLRNSYVTYLLVAAFIWMVVESITHRQLLIPNERVPLPIFGLETPVVTFFILAPLVLMVFHGYFLIHTVQFAKLLQKNRKDMTGYAEGWRNQVHGSLFAWYLLEPKDIKWPVLILNLIFVRLSFWSLVPIILLRCQWKFLPYHNPTVTLLHQICLVLSLTLAWYFYHETHQYREQQEPKGQAGKIIFKTGALSVFSLAVAFTILIGLFSLTVLKIPQSAEENEAQFEGIRKPFGWMAKALKSEWRWNKRLLIKDVVERNFNLAEAKLAIRPSNEIIAAFAGKEHNEKDLLNFYKVLDLQKRDLRFANFSNADLRKSDFRGAQLQGAKLAYAQLHGADFGDAKIQDADLLKAKLQGASFKFSELQGADLREAKLQGADFTRAQLQGADLRGALLQGAYLFQSQMQGATLRNAKMQGARFNYAELQGVDFRGAQLQGAYLEVVNLQGADLRNSKPGKLGSENFIIWARNLPERQRANFFFRMKDSAGQDTIFPLHEPSFCHNLSKYFSQPMTENQDLCAPRKEIYKSRLLCQFPKLIDQQADNIRARQYDPSVYSETPAPLFTLDELKKIIKGQCPEHLYMITSKRIR